MKEIVIISEDRPGVLAEISEALANAGVNIETIDSEAIHGTAVTVVTVDRYDDGLRALAQTPFRAVSEDAIVVQLDDKPGELARITRRLNEASINLRSVRILRREGGKSIVAIAAERTQEAIDVLRDVLVTTPNGHEG